LLFYYIGYSRIRNLMFRLRRMPVVRFITFHDIPPEAKVFFKANLHFLKRCTNVVSLDDYFFGRLSHDKINVVITFDDGFKSWVTDAIPILKKLALPATFFVSSGFVDLAKEDEAEFIRSKLLLKQTLYDKTSGGLSSEDVKKIVAEGFTVGGHTLNHCDLSKLHDNVQLRYEIAQDKMRLEKLTGSNIGYFAYPSGEYQNSEINLVEMLKELGYRGAVSLIPGFNSVGTNPYLLCRELTYAWMPERVFRAIVYGNYDAVSFLKQQLQKVLRQT